jgi:hypothetical protein
VLKNNDKKSTGGITMPWILLMLVDMDYFLPFVIFGCLSLLSFKVTLLLPFDTTGKLFITLNIINKIYNLKYL